MHQPIQASLRKLRYIGLFALVDLIKLVRAEGDDPDFPIDDIDTVRAIQFASGRDLLRLVSGNLPDGVGSRRLESVGASLHSSVGDVDCLPVGCEIVEEGAAGDEDFALR